MSSKPKSNKKPQDSCRLFIGYKSGGCWKERLFSSIRNVIQNGPAEFGSLHSGGNHLGHTSSKDNRAKSNLWKHFKEMPREQCIAPQHAEKTCTALQTMEAGWLHQCAMIAALGSAWGRTVSIPQTDRTRVHQLFRELLVWPFWCTPECDCCVHSGPNESRSCSTETIPVGKRPNSCV